MKNPNNLQLIANRKRHPDFFTFKKRIESATTSEKLESHRQALNKFVKANKGDDANDLMVMFFRKEDELNLDYRNDKEYQKRNNPFYESEIDTMVHRKLAV